MDRVFQKRADWFDVGVVPGIRRRTTIGALVIGLCIAAWAYWDSWVPLAVAFIVVVERIFEFASIPKTKEIIASLSVRANENGLAFYSAGVNGLVVYPWSSLTYGVEKSRNGASEVIWIKDRCRKNSKQKLVGFKGMSELVALIENNADRRE